MLKIAKIFTISLGIVGSALLSIGLIGSFFSSRIVLDYENLSLLFRIAISLLCLFFIISSFIFSRRNWGYKIARFSSAIILGFALFFIVSKFENIDTNISYIFISISLMFYNLCDIAFRKIKIPQLLIFLPMSIIFITQIVNYSRNDLQAVIVSSVFLTILFGVHLCVKSSSELHKTIDSDDVKSI